MDKDKREGWLRELKTGDKVVVESYWHGYSIRTIDKITPTGRINICGTTYDPTGWELNTERFTHHNQLLQLTPELETKILEINKRKELLSKIKNIKWDSIHTEILDKVINVLQD